MATVLCYSNSDGCLRERKDLVVLSLRTWSTDQSHVNEVKCSLLKWFLFEGT